MRVLVNTELHFMQHEGRVFSDLEVGGYSFWQRYLAVFDEVIVVARVSSEGQTAIDPSQLILVEGMGVSVIALPDYTGPRQYLRNWRKLRQMIGAISLKDVAIITRLPSPIGQIILRRAIRQRHPYGAEVIGDPYDVFAAEAIDHPLRRFFRWWFTRQQRFYCAKAIAAAYVTENTLQQRYPPAPGAFSTFYSSVELPENAFVAQSRRINSKAEFRLVVVATMTQPYKAIDILIQAMALCRQRGLPVILDIVGDGRYRSELEMLVDTLHLGEYVRFLGQLPAGEAVRAQLDQADLFVLPSRTEGLPRAMIEAMARGLPCIGTRVGGIPELLSSEDMVEPGNAIALASKIGAVLTDPERMAAMSARNLAKARLYHADFLRQRRNQFYEQVKNRTQAWLNHESSTSR